MRKIAILIVILLAGYVMAFSANGQTLTQYQFVGSKNSDVYHYPNCSYVDQSQEEKPTATTQPESTLTPNPSPAVPEITSTVLVIAIIAVSAIMIVLYQKKQPPSVGSEC